MSKKVLLACHKICQFRPSREIVQCASFHANNDDLNFACIWLVEGPEPTVQSF